MLQFTKTEFKGVKMANRTSINEFTEAERIKIQNVYKNGIAASTPEEVALYTEWEAALAYQKALSDQRTAAIKAELATAQATYQAIANSAMSTMETLKAEALARLEQARNGQA